MIYKNKPLVGWKIWYGDGTIISSKETTWEDAPLNNVQIIMLYENYITESGNNYRVLINADDLFYKDGDRFGSCMEIDSSEARGSIKYGKLLGDTAYFTILNSALEDRKWQ